METQKNKGGRKKKPDSQKKKMRPVYATDAEWDTIKQLAANANEEVSPFVIKKTLS